MNILRTLCMTVLIFLPVFSLMAQNLEKKDDNSWISIQGTVVETATTGFELDYGSGFVWVQMNDWKWYKADHPIELGDKVRVNGRVEDDQRKKSIVVADNIYVEDLNTYFFSEDGDDIFQPAVEQDRVFQLSGIVVSIDNRRFTMNLGSRKVIIDTTELPYNPLDEKGYQQLKVGDSVYVTGELKKDNSPFDSNFIMASTVTTALARERAYREN
ncbi:MAG: OB-fold nucleic acid binding domain-containing protein [Desulforhopalus sp.]